MILCASKDDEVVEYAMSRTLSPIMVAEYQLQLPDKSVLQKKLPDMIERRATDFVELKDADDFYDMIYYEHEEYLISNGILNEKEDITDFEEPF